MKDTKNKSAVDLGKLAKGKPKTMTEAAVNARRISSPKGVDRLREIRQARKGAE